MSRLGNASELIGFGRRALGDAIAYGSERVVGDSLVVQFQGIQWTVADCYGELYGASLARDRAAVLADGGAEHHSRPRSPRSWRSTHPNMLSTRRSLSSVDTGCTPTPISRSCFTT